MVILWIRCPLKGEETTTFTGSNNFHYFHLTIVFFNWIMGHQNKFIHYNTRNGK